MKIDLDELAVAARVTLAMVERIRELETALGDLIEECVQGSEEPHYDYGDLRALLRKGAVIP